jgi:hypothetical protein
VAATIAAAAAKGKDVRAVPDAVVARLQQFSGKYHASSIRVVLVGCTAVVYICHSGGFITCTKVAPLASMAWCSECAQLTSCNYFVLPHYVL